MMIMMMMMMSCKKQFVPLDKTVTLHFPVLYIHNIVG